MKFLKLLFLSSLFATFTPHAYADEDPYPGMKCTECHDDRLAKPFVHAPAKDDCTQCHARHGSDTGNPYRLFQRGNQVCLTCHEDPSTTLKFRGRGFVGHPVVGHQVSGPKDPLYPQREFGCVSCHNPHSAPTQKLFRYDVHKDRTPYQGQACAVCHFDIYNGNSKPPPPPPPWD